MAACPAVAEHAKADRLASVTIASVPTAWHPRGSPSIDRSPDEV